MSSCGGQKNNRWNKRIISTISIVLIYFSRENRGALLLQPSYLFIHSLNTIDPLWQQQMHEGQL